MALKKTGMFAFLLLCALVLSGCDFALAPAGTGRSASLALRLASLIPDVDGSGPRAIVQGAGYLYIRTIGGPAGNSGSFYGPYSVSSGSDFVTTDIPAGNFSSIVVLYSGKLLDDNGSYPYLGNTYNFRGIMTLPDAQMAAFLADESVSGDSYAAKQLLGTAFENKVSMGQKNDVTLRVGSTTTVSLVLEPILDNSSDVSVGSVSSPAFTTAAPTKRFYRLSGIAVPVPALSGSLSYTLSSASATLNQVAFFTSSGKQLPASVSGVGLSTGLTWSLGAAAVNAAVDSTGSVQLYIYLDFNGSLNASVANTTGISLSINGGASPAYQGKTVLFAIYDSAGYADILAGKAWFAANALYYGIIKLDASSGNGTLMIPVPPGPQYYISAQIDEGGNYAGLSSLSGYDIAKIVSYRNDYVTNGSPQGLVALATGNSASVSSSNFTTNATYVYFASSSGGGTGSVPSSPLTLDLAVAAANALSVSDSAQIYVIDDISNQAGVSISRDTAIMSYGSAVRTIRSQSLGGTTFFYVMSGGSLSFQNMTLDASIAATTSSIIRNEAQLTFGYNTTLIGNPASTAFNGGGVRSLGSSFTMYKSAIRNCGADPSSGMGGAIYLEGGSCTIDGASALSGNRAWKGGAIYALSGTTCNLTSATVSGNTDTVSPVCYSSTSTLNAGSVTYTGNSPVNAAVPY